jgi:hypothetical protein
MPHPYIPLTDDDRRAMLATIGASSTDSLFAEIPTEHRDPPLDLPPALSEVELMRDLHALAGRNRLPGELLSFLGAGAYQHFIPSVVDHIIRRGEFLTAYTPYQPEISQGTLQAAFEFQSLVCELTGMDVAKYVRRRQRPGRGVPDGLRRHRPRAHRPARHGPPAHTGCHPDIRVRPQQRGDNRVPAGDGADRR